MELQIDVKKVLENEIVQCNLIVDGRNVKMFIQESDYNHLIKDGFFIRDGKEADSAGCINTTNVYEKKNYNY